MILVGIVFAALVVGVVKGTFAFARRLSQGRVTADHVSRAIAIPGGIALAWWLISVIE